uniref:Aminopeptidase n=1 Tax=Panagrolaimus sp. PS1159 TaxID=55785 RepID=A0AC35FYB5_9BILA
MTATVTHSNGSPTKFRQNGTTAGGGASGTKRVSCSILTFLILLIITLAALLLSIIATYFITKNHLESLNPNLSSSGSNISGNNYLSNLTTLIPVGTDDLENEEEMDHSGPSPQELRLPKSLEPIWYNLTMRINVPGFVPIAPEKNLTFSAAMIIKLHVKEATKKIELNAITLNLSNNTEDYSILIEGLKVRSFKNPDHAPLSSRENLNQTLAPTRTKRQTHIRKDSGIKIIKVTLNETLEKVIFELSEELEKDAEYYFQFRYSGYITNKLAGLYLTTYQDIDGKMHYAAVTQMEPTDARRMVPCFDEPEFKAIWKIRVHHPVGSKAVSNAREIVEEEPDEKFPDFVYTTFEETPKMSSYLLALCVSDFEYVEGSTDKGTRFRIWSRKEALDETQFALYAGIKVLTFFENYYGIDFPLHKQDMMAFPDFAAGAMENWGLVTYRERVLLFNEKLYTPLQKQYVATVVAHELAHQWFGNLVTMKWWNDLWLNEGFATLMEYAGVDAIDPNYKMEDYFLLDALDNALARDAMATSHPLSFPILKAEDVSEAFDQISYDKGASVMRMLRTVLGETNFKKGLNIYLTKHAYSNAEHTDLWKALTEVVPDNLTSWNGDKFDVDDFAKKWTEQMGFPVITVSTTSKGVQLTQKRFKMDENAVESSRFKNAKFWYKWDVPIWYTIDGAAHPMTWLHTECELNLTNSNDLVFVNSDSDGFYRVKYDDEQMSKINQQLQKDHTKIASRSRARYIDDAFTMAQAGQIPYDNVLEMSKYLENENDFVPLDLAMNGFHIIAGYFGDEPDALHFRKYMTKLFQKRYNKVADKIFEADSVKDVDFFENQLNVLITRSMCEIKNEDCTQRAIDSYTQKFVYPCQSHENPIASNCSTVPVNVRKSMLEMFEREPVQVERDRLMYALSCSRDTYTLKRLMNMAVDINDTVVRLQDKSTVFSFVGGTHIGEHIIFDFFIQNWDTLYNDLKDQQTLLKRFVQASLTGKTERRVQEIEDFLAKNKATTANLDVFKQQLEIVQTNAKWMARNYKSLVEWFKKNANSGKILE